jgi:hypothetical protein
VGRNYSFSSFRVTGYWHGSNSGVWILPPPDRAPRAEIEMADHPFILGFPVIASDVWRITNYRWMRAHRDLTLLLNILLAGRTSFSPKRTEHFWARVPSSNNDFGEIKWVERFFTAELDGVVTDELTPPACEQLETVEPEAYSAQVGHDLRPLRVPADLDESICLYFRLSPTKPSQVQSRYLLGGYGLAPMGYFRLLFVRVSRISG